MYFEEKVIDGILSWRSTPNGEWTAFSLKELTHRYDDQAEQLRQARDKAVEMARDVGILAAHHPVPNVTLAKIRAAQAVIQEWGE